MRALRRSKRERARRTQLGS
ncbi:hypothetical protein [Methylobacterium sp. Leaf113]